MPAWAWWALISGGLCVLSWLYGRLSWPETPSGNGPWAPSWAVYFSPNGGAARTILACIRSAQQTILVQAHLFYSTRLAGALVRAHPVDRPTPPEATPQSFSRMKAGA